ncbi:hypothetical protein [Senegalia massiliensis]|uniref:Uncharacterized protein n=1 Tax=Senegalia massiliensis TaxID=1720316 RepID=A0A845R540_9CLOT|nr:hypothetical protein [Senegalia massiliensis]NBI07623.1 hypothetical protein [Senegalia massiliensis]
MNLNMIEKEKDIQLYKAIAKTGLITEDLAKLLGMSRNRLNNHIKEDNIIKKGVYMMFGDLTNIYTLSDKSKNKMRKDFLIDIYKSDTSQIEHDYVLAKIYMYLNYKEKESWITETGLKYMYQGKKTTDGLYITNNNRIGVEVITDSYSKSDIEEKKDFIRSCCDNYIMIHTHKDIEYRL